MTDRNEKKLTIRQSKAIQSLLTGASVQETAKQIGVARMTIYTWLNDPVFSGELKQAENEVMAGLTRSLTALGLRAIQTLESLIESETLEPSQRIKAANVILTNLLRLYEIYQLEERVNRLENDLNQTMWSEL